MDIRIRFDDRVAIVTGAGTGLGRCYALGLAARGAKVVVNDLGLDQGRSQTAEAVVDDIRALGGDAIAHGADVSDREQVEDMVATAQGAWGKVDILVNNAGILRDKSFTKMTLDDFRKVLDVHLMGSFNVTQACWPIMRAQQYGRIVLTSSLSGLYGNFGQANYGAAKAAMIGLMNVLHMEGARENIHVNTLAPSAATQMTIGLLPPAAEALMAPEKIAPGVLFLVSEDAPSRVILAAGAGGFAQTRIYETLGVSLPDDEVTPEQVAAAFPGIQDENGMQELTEGSQQTLKFLQRAAQAKGLKLS